MREIANVVQIKKGGPSFWVFCNDGTVWNARYDKEKMSWKRIQPSLPGSIAARED